jgi:hypothetical protein
MSESGGRPRVKHYQYSSVEPWDVIVAWNLDFFGGNVVKYLCRYQHKGAPLNDLKKAQGYLNQLVKLHEDTES